MRSDYLVSFCLVSEQPIQVELLKLIQFSDIASAHFKYFEIIYTISELERDNLKQLANELSMLKNVRTLVVPTGVNLYKRRLLAASEAIGEVVVVSAPSEILVADQCAMAAECFDKDQILMARSNRRRSMMGIYYSLMRWLSGYQINSADMKTIAIPRGIVTMMLARPTAVLDLRFEPKKFRYPFRRVDVDNRAQQIVPTPLAERYELVVEIISASASDFLRHYSLFSVFVTLGSVLYAIYAVIVVLTQPNVQPGWFSTSIIQSASVGFIALALGLICLGVAEIFDQLKGREKLMLTQEFSNTSFFADTDAVNVEMDDRALEEKAISETTRSLPHD